MMTVKYIFAFLLFCCLASCEQENLRFFQYLDKNGEVLLSWDLNNNTDEIVMELRINTTGWIGLGLFRSGTMNRSDMVFGGVEENSTYFFDACADGYLQPRRDITQNYNLLSLTEYNGFTCMRFSRKLQTCDREDMDITEDTIKVFYAFGASDIFWYHGNHRDAKSILLLSKSHYTSPPNMTASFDLQIHNFSLPMKEMVYGCRFVALPNVTQKYHIYKIEPIIQQGNEDIVHQIVVFGCFNKSAIDIKQGECTYERFRSFHCSQVITSWVSGSEGFQFPDNAGISMGAKDDFRVVLIEVHYNNSEKKAERQDSSGIRFHYTPELRTNDIGILTTGAFVHPSFFIPPKMESFKTYSICKTDSFVELNGQKVEDMVIFASVLHTHSAGRAFRVAHFRNGSQIGFLSRDNHYDFMHQTTRFLNPPVTLIMGDEIVMECTYNTMDRNNVTFSGNGLMNEKCIESFYYYPKNNISMCSSFYDADYVARSMGYSGSRLTSLDPWAYSVKWDEWKSKKAENASKESNHTICIVAKNGTAMDFGRIWAITDNKTNHCNSTSFHEVVTKNIDEIIDDSPTSQPTEVSLAHALQWRTSMTSLFFFISHTVVYLGFSCLQT